MAAGVTKRLWEIGDIVDMLEGWEQSGCAEVKGAIVTQDHGDAHESEDFRS